MADHSGVWAVDPHEGEDITFQGQLACAKRELALRKQVYPRWIAAGRMRESTAVLEVNKMAAIVKTLQRLVDLDVAGLSSERILRHIATALGLEETYSAGECLAPEERGAHDNI